MGSLAPEQSPELNPLPSVKDSAPGASLRIASPAVEGSPSASAGIFVGCKQRVSGQRESPLPSAGAGTAVARCREPSFLPAEGPSARFQTSLILSNLWVSMKSLQFDTQSVQSGSQSCAIPSSLFWNPVCVFIWYERKPDVPIPQRKLWPAHGRYSAVFTCVSFAVSEILTVQFRSDSLLLTAVETH